MAIIIKINGNSGSKGFLLAPSGTQEFPMTLSLETTDGSTVDATLVVLAPASVNVQLSSSTVSITSTAQTLQIVAKAPSEQEGDLTVQVKVGDVVQASCKLTAIASARLRFGGRFQARFATDGDFFNEPRGTDAGWNFALEGEPDFVPATDNIPTRAGMAVGRVVRLQNAVALRPHVAPIGVTVVAVEGEVGANTVSFAAGDPVIGEAVSLGPDTYLAANAPAPPGPPPFETYDPGFEPMENFELHVGTRFSGKPSSLTSRPQANGFFQLTAAEKTKYGVVALNQFASQRKKLLLTDYHNLSPADRTGTPAGRNLATRIGHLGGSSPDAIPARQGTLPPAWSGQETYNGTVDAVLAINPGDSVVMTYFQAFPSFRYSGMLLNYHSDEQCGQYDGTLQPLTPVMDRQLG